MIKKSGFIILVILHFVGKAQTMDSSVHFELINKVDSMLLTYERCSNLTRPEYQKGSKIDALTVNEFKSIFIPGAEIADEICPAFFDRNFENPYQLVDRKIEEYCTKISEIYPAGLQVKLTNANYSFSELSNNRIFIVLEKTIKGRTAQGVYIRNTDTIEMEVLIYQDRKKVIIMSTRLVGHTLNLINDSDSDFVSNEKDKCKKTKWFGNKGCPPRPKIVGVSMKNGKSVFTYHAKKIQKEMHGKSVIKVLDKNNHVLLQLEDNYKQGDDIHVDLTNLDAGIYTIQIAVEGRHLDPVRVNKI